MITPDFIFARHSLFFPYSIQSMAVDGACEADCEKSQRGVVLVSPDGKDYTWASNGPPIGFECDGSDWCKSNCNKVAVHAEERAIIQAARDLTGWEMFHVKISAGNLVPSGPPSCWQCSRMIVEAGIAGMWLFHEDGWKRYTAEEFHRLTLEYCMPR